MLLGGGVWLGWAQGIMYSMGPRYPKGKVNFWGCPAHWKSLWMTSAVSITASARLVQPTALLPTGTCLFSVKNPPTLRCGLSSKFFDHFLRILVLLLEFGIERLVAGFCGLADIMQQVRSNYAYWKQREGVESPVNSGQQSPTSSWDASSSKSRDCHAPDNIQTRRVRLRRRGVCSGKLETAGTHKSVITHAGTVLVTRDFVTFWPQDKLVSKTLGRTFLGEVWWS